MKKNRSRKILWAAVFCIFLSAPGSALLAGEKLDLKIPDSTMVQILELDDGSVLMGRIMEIGTESVLFKWGFGTNAVRIENIRSVREVPVEKVRQGKYWFPNPNATRLFFSPTGRMLEKGEKYFADYYVFFPAFNIGITDQISLGGGLSLIPGKNMEDQIWYFTPKIGLSTGEKLNWAAGALIIRIPDFDDDDELEPEDPDEEDDDIAPGTVGLVYGVGTYGSPDASLTFGLGYGYAGNEIADKPLVLVGGEKRISRRLALVSENLIFPGVDKPLVSYGCRFLGENLSIDLAFFSLLGGEPGFPGMPYIDFMIKF
ncbi:hypothetical protein JW906_07090 [bacterium]|nr:hypothetical protein [bacterium]